MTHRFPIKEIARQAGLGTATVDRVLNDRPNVSPQTRNRVLAAIDELAHQERQLSSRGRRLFVDVVVEAPQRFSTEIRRAIEGALPSLAVGVFRPRFVFQETMRDDEVVAILNRILRRGSDGVCLKARDVGAIGDQVDRLETAGIPVVTLVTDLPHSRRSAYVGVDNAKAGRSAAYLLARTVQEKGGTVLATRSQEAFSGEAERYAHFRAALAEQRPDLRVVDVSGGGGLRQATALKLHEVLAAQLRPAAIYSMGGGNAAILSVLRQEHIEGIVFVAHDLDAENRSLLGKSQITFVLHHDLKADARNMLLAIASRHGLVPKIDAMPTSDVQFITPINIPV